MALNSISNSGSALQRQAAAVDRAASRLVRATLSDHEKRGSGPGQAASVTETPQLPSATVELLVSRRMFTAAVRMAESVNEGIVEALKVGGYDAAA
jgi:hypothetical protein